MTTTPRILLDQPGPFELGSTLTGRVEGLPSEAAASYEISAQGIATGLAAASRADSCKTLPSTGVWQQDGRFSCRINGSDAPSRAGALYCVNWAISLVRVDNGETVASVPIETRPPPPKPRLTTKQTEVFGYRQSKQALAIPELTERPKLAVDRGLATPIGCLFGASVFAAFIGYLLYHVVNDATGGGSVFAIVGMVVFALVALVFVVMTLLTLFDTIRRRQADAALAPVVEVSGTALRRGEPLRIDVCFSPKRPITAEITAMLRKIEIASTGSGSSFEKWEHALVLEKKTEQKILKPGEDTITFLWKIPETEDATTVIGGYSIVWDVIVAVQAQDVPDWQDKFALQVVH